jgi:hypothetical protein
MLDERRPTTMGGRRRCAAHWLRPTLRRPPPLDKRERRGQCRNRFFVIGAKITRQEGSLDLCASIAGWPAGRPHLNAQLCALLADFRSSERQAECAARRTRSGGRQSKRESGRAAGRPVPRELSDAPLEPLLRPPEPAIVLRRELSPPALNRSRRIHCSRLSRLLTFAQVLHEKSKRTATIHTHIHSQRRAHQTSPITYDGGNARLRGSWAACRPAGQLGAGSAPAGLERLAHITTK